MKVKVRKLNKLNLQPLHTQPNVSHLQEPYNSEVAKCNYCYQVDKLGAEVPQKLIKHYSHRVNNYKQNSCYQEVIS